MAQRPEAPECRRMVPLLALDGQEVGGEVTKRVLVTVLVAAITSTATFFAGRWYGRYRSRRQWATKDFSDRVTVSLNTLADGWLHIRTILERSVEEVFLSSAAVAKVTAASRRTTPAEPLLPIDPDDRWYLLNFVLNAVAEVFAVGAVRRDAGERVVAVRYGLFLTCEVLGEERIRKVRAMLLRLDHLTTFPYRDSMPQVENPWHVDRVKTLRAAAALYATDPSHFLMIELCV